MAVFNEEFSSLVEVLQARARSAPDRLAMVFDADDGTQGCAISYGELDRRARAIASILQSRRLQGEPVLLALSDGPHYLAGLFGCCYANAIAVPAFPPRGTRRAARLASIIADSGAAFALTAGQQQNAPARQPSNFDTLERLQLDALDLTAAELWEPASIDPHALAVIQYTSGSTRQPRGVMLSHHNVLSNLRAIHAAVQLEPDDCTVQWIPLFHDMGLINQLYAVAAGCRSVLLAPQEFARDPLSWLRAITRHRAAYSCAPNFAYAICCEESPPRQIKQLDLSCWRVAAVGAEPIRAATLQRFAATFGPQGFSRASFFPCYGLAEFTLAMTGDRQGPRSGPWRHPQICDAPSQPRTKSPAAKHVGCGAPAAGHEVQIVDPEMGTPVTDGELGEIWARGPSMGCGYWKRPAESAEVFGAYLANGEGPFLRTGDLGFQVNQELFITGRIKDLIIVRGTNHYPQDIEWTAAAADPRLLADEGAAFAVRSESEDRLVLVQAVRRGMFTQLDGLFSSMRQAIFAGHEIQVDAIFLVKPGHIPRTTSGKIQRQACREALLRGELSVLARWSASDRAEDTRSSSPPSEAGEDSSQGSAAGPRRVVLQTAFPGSEHQPTEQTSWHDELEADFFRLFLDRRFMAHSAAHWEQAHTLDAAQQAALCRIAELARIDVGSDVLEVGCGWGGFLRYCVEEVGACQATGLTQNRRQYDYIRSLQQSNERITPQHWSRYRAHGQHDAVVSIGAFEHLASLTARARGLQRGIYRRFFEACHRAGNEDARLVVQSLVSLRQADSTQIRRDASFLAGLFPRSSLPALAEMLDAAEGLFEVESTTAAEQDCLQTFEAWRHNLVEAKPQAVRRCGTQTYSRYVQYLDALIRSLAGGYSDLVQLTFRKRVPAPACQTSGIHIEETADHDSGPAKSVELSKAHSRPEHDCLRPAPSVEAIASWLKQRFSLLLDCDQQQIDPHKPFAELGVDSLQAVKLISELGDWLGRPLAPTLAWDYPNIYELSLHLGGEPAEHHADRDRRAPLEPIAIVGIGCRFPGARNPEEFWQLLRHGGSGIVEIPADRWSADAYFDDDFSAVGKMVTRWGGFLQDVDRFDAQFFGITPREAARMDPQQRLLLEVAWETFENAGWPKERFAGSPTGVFIGIGATDYSTLLMKHPRFQQGIDAYTGTGNALSIAANRISYALDLRGPSVAVDTACSSALVALHLACQAVHSGECAQALAGAVNIILVPETTIALSKARMLSPDGQCKTFDADANGYVRGEGCGLFVLKKYADAVRDGDTILALIRGSAVNQDGRTSGISAPSGPSQQRVVRAALARAGIETNEVGYFEAHGTGTPLGDPIEVNALSELFSDRPADGEPCYLGSVKANIGHLETAAGAAGIIKTVLMFQHQAIPPQRNFRRLNPHINLDASPFAIPGELQDWTSTNADRVAGVSSFGFGGTNAHVVLQESPPTLPVADGAVRSVPATAGEAAGRPYHVLTISARSPKSLRSLVQSYAQSLESQPDNCLADFCFSANTGRTHFDHRLAARAAENTVLAQQLRRWLAEDLQVRRTGGDGLGNTAFLYTGQGSQYAQMGRQLYASQATFRRAIDQCSDLLQDQLEVPLTEVLFASEAATARLVHQTVYTQPALFAIEYALTQLWAQWGLHPHVVLGHSLGEYVAAWRAGVFDLETALQLVVKRARLMHHAPGSGLMATVLAAEDRVRELVAGSDQAIAIAAVNGPQQVVVSGSASAIRQTLQRCQQQGLPAQLLDVSHAFHSSLMEPILDEFERFAGRFSYQPPELPFVSTLTGTLWGDAPLDAAYWRRQIRQPVRFLEGLQSLAAFGANVTLELGPQPTLTALGRRCLGRDNRQWLISLREDEENWSTLLDNLAAAYTSGADVDWRGFDQEYSRRRVSVPNYAYQPSRHWVDLPQAAGTHSGGFNHLHPLLGGRQRSADDLTRYECVLDPAAVPWLKDHMVQGSIVVPATAYVEIALAAAAELFPQQQAVIKQLQLQQMLSLRENTPQILQILLTPQVAGEVTFRVLSQPFDSPPDAEEWRLHAYGNIQLVADSARLAEATRPVDLAAIRARCDEEVDVSEYYQFLAGRGLEYGPTFKGIEQLWRRDGEVLARVRLTDEKHRQTYQLHPALLDACLQAVAKSDTERAVQATGDTTYVPVLFERVVRLQPPSRELWVHCVNHSLDSPDLDQRKGSLTLLDPDGQPLTIIDGFHIRSVGSATQRGATKQADGILYHVAWQLETSPTAPQPSSSSPSGSWLVLGYRQQLVEEVSAAVERQGDRCLRACLPEALASSASAPAAIQQLLDQAESLPGFQGVIYLTPPPVDFAAAPDAALDRVQQLLRTDALRLMQSLAARRAQNRLAIVTQGAQSIGGQSSAIDPTQSLVWGLGRTASNEHPELNCKLIDLSAGGAGEDEIEQLAAELDDRVESQVALRHGQRWLPRLETHQTAGKDEARAGGGLLQVPAGASFRLEVSPSKTIETLAFRGCQRAEPGPGLVEVAVRAAGLNFSDILKAMGLYPGVTDAVVPLGLECAGVVTGVGPGVTRFAIGDEVLGCAPYSFAAHTLTPEYGLVAKPSQLSFEAAATLPVAFLTAYHALHDLGQLTAGQRVLIHAAAGGVGLAAVQIAQHYGCEIFATAGSDEKRNFLRELGIQHVMDSRSLEFADQVLSATADEGVDVVLNSLPGEAIARSLAVLRPYGRFLEIGKTDIYQNRPLGLLAFKNALTYSAIDMDRMFRDRPETIQRLLSAVIEKVESGAFRPLPATRFALQELTAAFRYMSQRKNIGKIVVSLPQEPISAGEQSRGPRIQANASYLITGGLGALGLRVARWLVTQGARELILVGRRQPGAEAQAVIGELEQAGAVVHICQADVSCRQEVERLVSEVDELSGEEPGHQESTDDAASSRPSAGVSHEPRPEALRRAPLRGIFHAAGVLDDGILLQQDEQRFARVLAPKVAGAWNLHTATSQHPLDFFVLFSSIAGVLGSPGQSNYAAANSFLDAFAHYRRAQGRPALSINWGPWAEAGMAARTNDGSRSAHGILGLDTATALQALEQLLYSEAVQVTVAQINWAQALQVVPAPVPRILSSFSGREESGPVPALRDELLAAQGSERRELLLSYVLEQLVAVTGCGADELDPEQPLNSLGVDSLMAIELKNDIDSVLQTSLPIARFFEGITLNQLVDEALELVAARQPLAEGSDPGTGRPQPAHAPHEPGQGGGSCGGSDASSHDSAAARAGTAGADGEKASSLGPRAVLPWRSAGPRPEPLPLSSAQQRIWFLEQLHAGQGAGTGVRRCVEPGGTRNLGKVDSQSGTASFNLPTALRMTGPLEIGPLRSALQEVVQRHESLRTTFYQVAGQPFQRVSAQLTLQLPLIDLADLTAADRDALWPELLQDAVQRPFNLETGPLTRALVIRLAAREHLLVFVIHHIVSDGWSMDVARGEVALLYPAFQAGHASPLPEPTVQYADFAVWQRQRLADGECSTQLEYWREQLAGVSVLDLPTDRPRPQLLSRRGCWRWFTWPEQLADRLTQFSRRHGVTAFMTLLTAFQTLLARYSGQTDIAVGSPIANRPRQELEGLVGLFVNFLVLRSDLSGNPSFLAALQRVRDVCVTAYQHQDLPYEKLIEALQPERDLARQPLIQVAFVMQRSRQLAAVADEMAFAEVPVDPGSSKFDLALYLFEGPSSLSGYVEYSTELFDATTVDRLVENLLTLVSAAVDDPHQSIQQLPLLADAQRHEILESFNERKHAWQSWGGGDELPQSPHGKITSPDIPSCQVASGESLHQLFEQQVRRTPDRVAVIHGTASLTYHGLNQQANRWAHYLASRGIGREARVGVCLERSLDLVVALLAVLKAGATYVPIDPSYPRRRVAFMLADSEVSLLWGRSESCSDLGQGVDVIDAGHARAAVRQQPGSDLQLQHGSQQLAYVIYTSGSTGVPKGVAITHQSAQLLVAWVQQQYTPQEMAAVLASTSVCFDLSLFELFATLSCGGKVVLTENLLSLNDVADWHELSLINTVPSAMAGLLERTELPQALRTVNLAGEPLTADLVRQLHRLRPGLRVYDLYGPSEDTTYSTCALRSDQEPTTIGQPILHTRAYVLDALMQPVPVGVAAELFLSGLGLARCYLRRPELTAMSFLPDPFAGQPGQRMYRSGDICRWLNGGQLQFNGRIDDQVKVRGFRIELGEVEAAIRQLPLVGEAAVLVCDTPAGDRQLVAYVTPRSRELSRERVWDQLRESLPEFMLPTSLVVLPALPRTPNGKLDRQALPPVDASRPQLPQTYMAPRTPHEIQLARLWTDVLGVEGIGIHDNFFQLGGHSLLATQLIARLRDVLHIELPLRRLFEQPTIAQLSETLRAAERIEHAPIPPADRSNPLPLSFAQQRLWFLDQLVPNNPFYNEPVAMTLRGSLNMTALRRAFQEIVRRHESLRTTFSQLEGQPLQLVAGQANLMVTVLDLSRLPEQLRAAETQRQVNDEAQRTFDLQRGPLLRVTVVRCEPQLHIALLVLHHIVTDGWSLGVLTSELATLYAAFAAAQTSPLPELPIQYADFAVWQRKRFQGAVLDEHLAYWEQQLHDLPVLSLPTDRPRPAISTFTGRRLPVALSAELTEGLRRVSERANATLFMTLLATFQTLLSRFSGQTDIVVGSPIANRRYAELEGLIGFFVNSLVLRTDLSGNPTFVEVLERVREVCVGAYAHQDLPYEKLVEELQPERDINRDPLFQVVFQLQNAPQSVVNIPGGLEVSPYECQHGTAKFDLSLFLWEAGTELAGVVEYNTALFQTTTVEELVLHFTKLLQGVVEQPDRPIIDFSVENPAETRLAKSISAKHWDHRSKEFNFEP